MKNYKVLYKENIVHHFIVPAKSKKEAAQHVRDRIYWDLEPIDEISECDGVKDIEILNELPVSVTVGGRSLSLNLKDETTAKWWERVQDSRKNWLELKEEKRLAKQEEENNKLRTDF